MGLTETSRLGYWARVIPATRSLFCIRDEAIKLEVANASRECAKTPPTPAFTSEMFLLSGLADILAKNETRLTYEPIAYWNKKPYHPADIYTAAVELPDCYEGPLPITALPPAKDIEEFIRFVLGSNHKLTIPQQFEKLLDISGGNVLGAANLGMLGCRILARGWDDRFYPEISINPQVIFRATEHLAPFDGGADPLGDNYYYWTVFFATVVYGKLSGVTSKVIDKLFSVGAPMMKFIRRYIVGQSTLGPGLEPSKLGRLMGLMVVKYSDELIAQAQEPKDISPDCIKEKELPRERLLSDLQSPANQGSTLFPSTVH